MNVGKLIEKSILNYYNNKYKGLVPHPSTITRLCILGRVEGNWEEEERCPRTSPFTLTGITKPPSNKGKEKVLEREEKERRIKNTKEALVVRNVERRDERQSSPSFD